MTILTIGMPVYNGGHYIEKALQTLLDQTYKDFVIIVHDDCSTDSTEAIVNEYMKLDARIRYFRHSKNKGMVQNYESLLQGIETKYFMFADQDDWYGENFIEYCIDQLENDESLYLVTTYTESIDTVRNKINFIDQSFSTKGDDVARSYIKYKNFLHSGNSVQAMFCGIYRTEGILKTLPFRDVIGWDHIVDIKIMTLGDLHVIPKVEFYKRSDGASESADKLFKVHSVESLVHKMFPYLNREKYLLGIILESKSINHREKVYLLSWSISNFLFSLCIKPVLMKMIQYVKLKLVGDFSVSQLMNTKASLSNKLFRIVKEIIKNKF